MLDYYIKHHLKNDKKNTIFNVGANTGQEIEILKDLNCEIHAFEPHPIIFKILKEKYNDYKNVIFNEAAVWSSNEYKDLYFKNSKESVNGGATLIIHKGNISKNIKTKVKCIDVSEYIINLNSQVDLFWMDIEGAEYDIINHLLNTGMINRINHIYFEDHERRFKIIKRFFSYLYGKFYILKRFMIFKKLKKLGFEVNMHSDGHYIVSKKI
jgi:FkbM family methyltransferase